MEKKEIKERGMFEGCWRCKASLICMHNFTVPVLLGDYRALICVDCWNDWTVYADTLSEYRQLVDLVDEKSTRYAKAISSGIDFNISDLRDKEFELQKRLYTISESWCESVIERPKPEPEPIKELSPEEVTAMRERRRARLQAQLAMLDESNAPNSDIK